MTLDEMRRQLAALEAELQGVEQRRDALVDGIGALRTAIDEAERAHATAERLVTDLRPVGATDGDGRRTTPRASVAREDVLALLRGREGRRATTRELVEALGLPNGRSLNGVRRALVDEGAIEYADRVYRLTD